MQRLLYIAALPIDFDNLGGVPKKIICQASALSKAYTVDILFYFSSSVWLFHMENGKKERIDNAKSKLSVLMAVKKVINQYSYVGTYIRYPRADFCFISALKQLKKNELKVVVEIPTYPYDLEGNETFKGKIINVLDRYYRKKLHKYVDRIVTYSDDDVIFGVKTIRTINGIDFNSVSCDTTSIDVSNTINLVAVSAMFRVHGYERLIEGLNNYYSAGGQANIVLKLVGTGDERKKYQDLVIQYNLSDHVLFLGACYGDKLEEVYRQNAMGINSLAIHRQGLTKESTLKTKEYAAKGLPVLSSSFVDALSFEGNDEFVMQIPPDETPVDVDELVRFVQRVYAEGTENVRNAIREDGLKTCDISITMAGVIQYFMG